MDSPPRLEVINTGTELLFGSVVNTHLPYLGQELFLLGLRIQRQSTVPDGDAIRHAISEASTRSDIILVTGGLGPTKDDLTREIVAEFTNRELILDHTIRERIAKIEGRMTPLLEKQTLVPAGATILPNDVGTAPGLHIPGQPHFFLFPGPPRELKPMFENHAFAILRGLAGAQDVDARIFYTKGIGETLIEERIGDQLEAILGLEVGDCSRVEKNEVDIRVIGPRSAVEAADRIIRANLASYLAGVDSIGPSGRVRTELKPEPLNTLGLRFRNRIAAAADRAGRIKEGAKRVLGR